MKPCKIKKFNDLSSDIIDNELDMGIDIIKSGEFEIESIVDVFQDPKKVDESVVISSSNLTVNDVKRGDVLYITCLMKKKGTSMSSPSTQCTLRVRIVDMFSGWSYLNKIMK